MTKNIKKSTAILALSTLATSAGLASHSTVLADTVNGTTALVTAPSTETITPVSETPAPEVTKEQVDTAKANLTQANDAVVAQEQVVKTTQQEEKQAQNNLVGAIAENSTAKTNAEQSTPEAIANQETTVATNEQAVTEAEQAVETVKEATEAPQKAVETQEKVVADAQKEADAKAQAVKKADKVVADAEKALNNPVKPTISVADAQKAVTSAEQSVEKATAQITVAQKGDQKLSEDIATATKTLASKESTLKQKEDALAKIVEAMKNDPENVAPNAVGYHNQNDPRWGGKYYGNWNLGFSGCVPTSLSTVFSELKGREISPVEVANYLYLNGYFNNPGFGTGGVGVMQATRHYGLIPTSLGSQAELVTALKAGHFVVTAVQQDKFTPYGGTHELVLKGFSNGSTFVYDPYTRSNIGWYSISRLWAEQSWDALDRQGVKTPFVKIVTNQMAQLELQKAGAQKAVTDAKNAVNTAKKALQSLKDTPKQTPIAQASLVKAKAVLDKAKTVLDQAVIAEKSANTSLETKKAELKLAKADLAIKVANFAKADILLKDAKATLSTLQTKLTVANKLVTEKQTALANARTALNSAKAKLASMSKASATYKATQEKVDKLRVVLAEKVANTKVATDKLSELKANRDELAGIYSALKSAYKEPVTPAPTKTNTVPVVSEDGQIKGFINPNAPKLAPMTTISASTTATVAKAIANTPVTVDYKNVTAKQEASKKVDATSAKSETEAKKATPKIDVKSAPKAKSVKSLASATTAKASKVDSNVGLLSAIVALLVALLGYFGYKATKGAK